MAKQWIGKPVTLVGKVDKVINQSEFSLRSSDDQEVLVQLAKGTDSAQASIGKAVEVRGIAKDASTLASAQFTTYEADFDIQSYEQMLEY